MKFLLAATDTETNKQVLRIFWDEYRRDKKRSTFFSTIIPLSHFLRFVFIPLMISLIIQSLITQPGDLYTPLIYVASIVVASIISLITNNKGYTALFEHSERVCTRLIEMSMKNLMSQSYEFFANHKVGALSGDVNGFSRAYVAVSDIVFLQSSHVIIGFVTSLIIIGFMSPILLIPLLLLTVGIFLTSIRSYARRSPHRTKRKILTSQLNGSIADIFGNQLLIRIFGKENYEIDQTSKDRRHIESVARKEIAIIEEESVYRQLVLFGFQVVTLLVGIWLFSNNLVSIAALIFAVTYLGRLTDALFSITQVIRSLEQALLDAAPMVRILHQPISINDKTAASELDVSNGAISLANVDFRYEQSHNDAVFSKLSLAIPSGQRVGLAGHSGGGKTTLTKLLLRFADLDGGEITIDGQNIAEVTQSSLRSAIAYVPQEPFLFHRSLRDNIAYGREDATEEQILAAMRKAHANEFIDKLPNGLDTVVGERGVKLSGGQRQRIAIARAILKDAPILILDEATSALDSESEKYIQQALEELMKGRTSIIIAHRLSTIAKLDRIIVLDTGKIVEDGTHAELLKRDGVYARLWSHQSGGFIEE